MINKYDNNVRNIFDIRFNRIYWRRNMQTIENAATTIKEIWDYQHPVMHTWFVLSSLSLCVMFALLYFVI